MEIRKSVLLGFLSLSLYSSALPNHLFTFQENGIWSPDKNTPAMRLARDISRNYNQQVRPVIDDQTFTKVEHLYILHQIVYLDSKVSSAIDQLVGNIYELYPCAGSLSCLMNNFLDFQSKANKILQIF